MKKLFAGLLAAALMAFGFVAVSATSAVACSSEYTGVCQPTKPADVDVKKRVKRGKKVPITFNIEPKTGNASISGTVTTTCKNGKAVKSKTRQFSGAPVTINFSFGKRGTWKCKTKYAGYDSRNKKTSYKIRVR